MSEIQLHEHAWTDADFAGRNHALLSKIVGGVSLRNWQAMWVDGLNKIEAQTALIGSTRASNSTVTIGTGTKPFTLNSASDWEAGRVLRITSQSNNENYMVAVIDAIVGTALSVNVVFYGGSGEHADWLIGDAAAQGLVSSSGGRVTGDLLRDGAAGTERAYYFQTAGGNRAAIVLTDSAEAGDNAGSNLEFRLFTDAGDYLSTPLVIDRATGALTVGASTQIGGALSVSAGVTVGGTLTLSGGSISSSTHSLGSTGVDYVFNLGAYSVAEVEPTDDITITVTDWPSEGGGGVIYLTAGGEQTLDFSSFDNAEELPELQVGPGGDILVVHSPDGGTTQLITHCGIF